jgi:transposase-like protein
MTTTRKRYSPKFKARVAMEAIRGEKTLSQLGSQFRVHPMQIAKWRKAALDQLPELFVDGRTRKGRNDDADQDALYEEIGRLKMELDWLKKKPRPGNLWVIGGFSGEVDREIDEASGRWSQRTAVVALS